jgi:hypothetical protein
MSRMNVENLLEKLARLDHGQGPAQSITEARADALVLGAMQRSGIVTAERSATVRPRGQVRLRTSALLGAGVVAITTAAAALVGGVGRESLMGWLGSAPPSRHAQAVDHGAGAARAQDDTLRRAPPPSAPMASVVAGSGTRTGAPFVGARSARTEGVAVPRSASAPEVPHGPTKATSVQTASSAAAPEPAVDLLARANQYRREHQYGRALDAYLGVAQRYPDTRQAEAARVAAADLRLEHLSDPKGAAEQYRAAASGTGALGEEAAYGLIEAHRAAGRFDLEKVELERFLARFPASPLAGTARSRLLELERHGW